MRQTATNCMMIRHFIMRLDFLADSISPLPKWLTPMAKITTTDSIAAAATRKTGSFIIAVVLFVCHAPCRTFAPESEGEMMTRGATLWTRASLACGWAKYGGPRPWHRLGW